MEYNFFHSLLKTVLRGVLLIGPLAIHLVPATWLGLTLGGVLVLGFDKLKAVYTSL